MPYTILAFEDTIDENHIAELDVRISSKIIRSLGLENIGYDEGRKQLSSRIAASRPLEARSWR